MVTTTDTTSPSPERIGVELMSIRTLRPSGTTARSPRCASPWRSRAAGPGAAPPGKTPARRRPHVITSSSCSVGWPGVRSSSTMRAPRGSERPHGRFPPPNTTTSTGEVSIRASRSARARSTARYVRALAIAVAACDANSTRISSSRPRTPPLPPCQRAARGERVAKLPVPGVTRERLPPHTGSGARPLGSGIGNDAPKSPTACQIALHRISPVTLSPRERHRTCEPTGLGNRKLSFDRRRPKIPR